ncbi:MAG: dienelactone hydrolase family protein, partial [Pseudomonadota bacterium]
KEGYVSFAADVYGKNIRPKDAKEAATFATKYKNDRALLRSHIIAAYNQIAEIKQVDNKKIVVMGYCFGGTTALELARSGAQLSGTVSFHGGLSNPTPENAKNIKTPVLVMHGADDPFIPPAEVQAFKDEMKKAGVNLQFITYPNAVHSFTNPAAGNDNSKGAAYNASADKASWVEFEKFIKSVL